MPFEIRALTSQTDILLGSSFFRSVWGGVEDVVPVDIAIVTGHLGGYFSGAFDDSGALIAASYGLPGVHDGLSVIHSHVTASRVSGAGFALKQHQRQWATERGFDAITWTFDPLVRRNCVFNLEKLGAMAVEYLVNFYGEMHDDLNRGEQSDRLFAFWPTSERGFFRLSNLGDVAPVPDAAEAPCGLAIGADVEPLVSSDLDELFANRSTFSVYLPVDIEALRQSQPEVSAKWRQAVRAVLQPCFASGAIVRQMIDNRSALLVQWPNEGVR